MTFTIAIIGAGIGGLTLGAELQRQGIEAHIYEQASELREVGAAVALSANSTRFLRERLAIGDELAAVSADVDGLVQRDGPSGEVIARISSRKDYLARAGAPYYGVYRPDLQALLARAAGEGTIHLNKRCVRVENGADRAVAHFADGDVVEADLLIGADGVRSLLRNEVVGYDDRMFSGAHAWRGMVEPDRLPSLPDPGAIQFWMGPGGHLLHYPIGTGAQNFFLVQRHDGPWEQDGWVVPAEPGEHLEHFRGWDDAVVEMISAAPAAERWALFNRPPLYTFSRGRITLIGDAAHAMVPHHGQGANQSIEDAVVLGECLREMLHDGTDLAAMQSRFDRLRIERTRKVQVTSLAWADQLHLPSGPAAERRNRWLAAPSAWDTYLGWIHEYRADAEFPEPTA